MRRLRLKKFIPDGDQDFSFTGRAFARIIARDPARYMLTADDAQRITRAMEAFHQALTVTLAPGGCSKIDTMQKDEARAKAKAIVREYGNIIRANPRISAPDKIRLRIRPRPAKPKDRTCPQTAPVLFFMGSIDGGSSPIPTHVLKFKEAFDSRTCARPAGAARLELFVELIDPDEPLPRHPGELGREWYLRSFTRNPMHVKFPMPARPMKVLYWARWADARGEVGPWSKTCVTRVEGWPNMEALENKRKDSRVVVSLLRRELPLIERSDERKLLECEEPIGDEPGALPEAA